VNNAATAESAANAVRILAATKAAVVSLDKTATLIAFGEPVIPAAVTVTITFAFADAPEATVAVST
jgi:hypothetical protein